MRRDDVRIEVAALTDADDITAVLQSSYPALLAGHYAPALLATALPRMTQANPTLLRSGTFYVARISGDRIVGCGGWTRERPGSGEIAAGVGHIRHFGTHPDHLRRGIGKRVLERCIAEAASCGIRTLECYSTLCAVGFYAAFGFAAARDFEVEFPGNVRFPAVHMLKSSRV
jgi:GNAT superfamily N-acetyltransferase